MKKIIVIVVAIAMVFPHSLRAWELKEKKNPKFVPYVQTQRLTAEIINLEADSAEIKFQLTGSGEARWTEVYRRKVKNRPFWAALPILTAGIIGGIVWGAKLPQNTASPGPAILIGAGFLGGGGLMMITYTAEETMEAPKSIVITRTRIPKSVRIEKKSGEYITVEPNAEGIVKVNPMDLDWHRIKGLPTYVLQQQVIVLGYAQVSGFGDYGRMAITVTPEQFDKFLAAVDKILKPANLVCEATFDDSAGFLPNKRLGAGEDAALNLKIANQSKEGWSIDAAVKVNSPDIEVLITNIRIQEIGPLEKKTITIPIWGKMSIKDGQTNILVEVVDEKGFGCPSQKIVLKTEKANRPQLVILPPEIDDGTRGLAKGNSNNLIENGETIVIKVPVENKSRFPAYKITAKLTKISQGIEVAQEKEFLGDLRPGERKVARLAIHLPKTYDSDKIQYHVQISEARWQTIATLNDKWNVNVQYPILAYELKVLDENGNGIIENGERIEITINPKNLGGLEAKNVRFHFNLSEFPQSKIVSQIADIPPHESANPQKLSLLIPLNYQAPLTYSVEMTQDTFPGFKETKQLAVQYDEPKLQLTATIIDQNNNNVLEQGESGEIRVRVKNAGGKNASGVRLTLSSRHKGVLLEETEKNIGNLPKGDSQTIKIPFKIGYGAASGRAQITAFVWQKHFTEYKGRIDINIVETKVEEIIVQGKETGKSAPISRSSPPVIAIATPTPGQKFLEGEITLKGRVGDDHEVKRVEIWLNNERLSDKEKGLLITPKEQDPKRWNFEKRVKLKHGLNEIIVRAHDDEDLYSDEKVIVERIGEKSRLFAVVIGVSNYKNIQALKYAAADAHAFRQYLEEYLDIDANNVSVLINEQVTKDSIRRTLGTELRRKVNPEDMAIIYFSGHGAPESDRQSPDGDGLEKYFLPHDADPTDLFTTAISMGEMNEMLLRLSARRIVFLGDTCFSGKAGGRTIRLAMKARLNDNFFDRLVQGRGTVFISASQANDSALEDDKLRHGVFTYYLLDGLKGKADYDGDGKIVIQEIFEYLSHQVPQFTRNQQRPVMKGEVEGEFVLGVIK